MCAYSFQGAIRWRRCQTKRMKPNFASNSYFPNLNESLLTFGDYFIEQIGLFVWFILLLFVFSMIGARRTGRYTWSRAWRRTDRLSSLWGRKCRWLIHGWLSLYLSIFNSRWCKWQIHLLIHVYHRWKNPSGGHGRKISRWIISIEFVICETYAMITTFTTMIYFFILFILSFQSSNCRILSTPFKPVINSNCEQWKSIVLILYLNACVARQHPHLVIGSHNLQTNEIRAKCKQSGATSFCVFDFKYLPWTLLIDRMGLHGSALFGVLVGGVGCLIAFALALKRDDTRGLISGGVDDTDDNWVDNCRTGGLGGGDDSGDTAESTDFEMSRLRGVSLTGGLVCGVACCILFDDDLCTQNKHRNTTIKCG